MNWVSKFIKEQEKAIWEFVRKEKAIVALSGGVDSSTTACLVHRVLAKEQVSFVTIDDGLRRQNEPEWVVETFDKLGIRVEIINASERFFEVLGGAQNPEIKRKRFTFCFYDVLAEYARKFDTKVLFQGTNKADVRETVAGVKRQHNILEQIGIDPLERYGFKIYEPLKELYKHQVREVARALCLPQEICERMPFPGPGLAIRVYGRVSPEKVALVRKATAITEELMLPFGAFQVLVYLGPKATGLNKKGKRNYGYVLYIRAVDSKDAMTATPTWIYDTVQKEIVARITSTLPEITHVLFDMTPKPPGTIEYE